MQQHRRILTIIGFFSILVMFTSCLSVPSVEPSKPEEKIEEKKEEDVVEQKKKMNRTEFALLVQSLLQKKDYDAALSLFDNSEDVELSVLEDISTKILKVSILISAGKAKDALLYLEMLEQEYPNNVELLYCRVMLAQSNKDEKAKNK